MQRDQGLGFELSCLRLSAPMPKEISTPQSEQKDRSVTKNVNPAKSSCPKLSSPGLQPSKGLSVRWRCFRISASGSATVESSVKHSLTLRKP